MATTSFHDATGAAFDVLPVAPAPKPHQSINPFFSIPETTVLIVGGGPIGVFCAVLLARYQIRSTIIEKHQRGLGLPKAHVMGPRTLEIFRQAGLDIGRLRKLGIRPEDADVVRFATCLVGYEYGKISLDPESVEASDVTPEQLVNLPQPRLEDYLYEVATQTGLITLWRGVEWTGSSATSDGLEESVLLNRKTQNTVRMRSKYLLACDGANAGSRAKLDIPFTDLPGQPVIKTYYVTVYFEADLSHLKSGLLFFIISPSILGTFICYDRASIWAFAMIYDPAVTPASTFSEDYCRSAIATVS
jgi:2-polyprenyl-6-methoxyphenol hydroxylase-like FAD-dependent oxidoreductase